MFFSFTQRSRSVEISPLQLFVIWFHSVESSGQDVVTALLGEALLKLLADLPVTYIIIFVRVRS